MVIYHVPRVIKSEFGKHNSIFVQCTCQSVKFISSILRADFYSLHYSYERKDYETMKKARMFVLLPLGTKFLSGRIRFATALYARGLGRGLAPLERSAFSLFHNLIFH